MTRPTLCQPGGGGPGAGPVDPVLLEIIAGSLASIEKEVETAIARTSRSPMIRDAHDFRAGIHDRLLRKLTGRSYSALVHPVVRDFPPGQMRRGDVFFHNDVCSIQALAAIRRWSHLCRRSAITTTSAVRCPVPCRAMPPASSKRD